jgi:hypothetical protein
MESALPVPHAAAVLSSLVHLPGIAMNPFKLLFGSRRRPLPPAGANAAEAPLQPAPPPEPGVASVFLAMPHYDSLAPEAHDSVSQATARHRVYYARRGCSLLAHGFNSLLCAALNRRAELRLTHWYLHHADIGAEPGHLDIMVEEMRRTGADVLSAVVPIKDSRGLTSTGWRDPECKGPVRRFTMREIHALPETFDAAAAGRPDDYLMVNTGLLLLDFTRPWVEEICFTIRDAIVKGPDGQYYANTWPEDWAFSHWAQGRGLRVFATRKVKVRHVGRMAYVNDAVWGEWDTDRGDRPEPETKPA